MKKFYILLSVACVAVSASAVKREAVSRLSGDVTVKSASVAPVRTSLKSKTAFEKAPVSIVERKNITRAEGEDQSTVSGLYYLPADQLMTLSIPCEGSDGYALGFASPYGKAAFWNYSIGVPDMAWSYSDLDDFDVVDNQAVWNVKTSAEEDLIISSGVGEFLTPELKGTVDGQQSVYSQYAKSYMAGGNPYMFLGDRAANIGLTYYQNTFMADYEGYQAAVTYSYSYYPGQTGFQSNGAATSWYNKLQKLYPDKELTDLELQNFTIIQPQPTSPYLMTKGWLWAAVSANAATQLTSYIYPFNEDGTLSDVPLAVGYAAIPAGQSSKIVFYYNALNEDGDEVEEPIVIDQEVFFTIEGFNGNPAIDAILVQAGFYPFSYALYEQSPYSTFIKSPDLYAKLSLKADGQVVTPTTLDASIYYFGPEGDEDTLSMFSYAQFATDATFPWFWSADGETSVEIPVAGGKSDVVLDAYYYNIAELVEQGEYTVSASDWISVDLSDFDPQTGLTTMTVSAAATETPRSGSVEIKGFGLTYTLQVNQGAGNAVSSIVVDKAAEYYDLQGRRVAAPEKGLYIKKSGNKTEKVIL